MVKHGEVDQAAGEGLAEGQGSPVGRLPVTAEQGQADGTVGSSRHHGAAAYLLRGDPGVDGDRRSVASAPSAGQRRRGDSIALIARPASRIGEDCFQSRQVEAVSPLLPRQLSPAHRSAELLVGGAVGGQQDQPAPILQVQLSPHHGRQPDPLGSLDQAHRSIEATSVDKAQGGHPQFGCPGDHGLGSAGTFQKGEVGAGPEFREMGLRHHHIIRTDVRSKWPSTRFGSRIPQCPPPCG